VHHRVGEVRVAEELDGTPGRRQPVLGRLLADPGVQGGLDALDLVVVATTPTGISIPSAS
jgi:hypothetical protein